MEEILEFKWYFYGILCTILFLMIYHPIGTFVHETVHYYDILEAEDKEPLELCLYFGNKTIDNKQIAGSVFYNAKEIDTNFEKMTEYKAEIIQFVFTLILGLTIYLGLFKVFQRIGKPKLPKIPKIPDLRQ